MAGAVGDDVPQDEVLCDRRSKTGLIFTQLATPAGVARDDLTIEQEAYEREFKLTADGLRTV